MPRKVDPHWGEDGFHDVEPLVVPPDEAAQLARQLGFDSSSPQATQIREEVEFCGSAYRRWEKRGADAFSRAEARKALEQALKCQHINYGTLCSLNERALQLVHDHLLMMCPSPVSRGDNLTSALLHNRIPQAAIRQAINSALPQLKATKGADRNSNVLFCVERLCLLYEDLTGKPATHSNKAEFFAYASEPQSKAGKFITACFRLIDPEVRGHTISSALRAYVEHRNRSESRAVHISRNTPLA